MTELHIPEQAVEQAEPLSPFTNGEAAPIGLFNLMPKEDPSQKYDLFDLWKRANVNILAAQRSLGEDPQVYEDLLGKYQSAITNGQESTINQTVHDSEVKAQSDVLKAMMQDKSVYSNEYLMQGAMQVYLLNEARRGKTALSATEQAAAEQMVQGSVADQTVAARAAEEARLNQDYDPIGEVQDLYAKTLLLDKLRAKVRAEGKTQSWMADAIDFITAFIPKFTEGGLTDPVFPEELLGNANSLLAAQQLMFSRDVSVEEFAALLPKMEESLRNSSAWFGENQHLIQSTLEQFATATPQNSVTWSLLRSAEFATLPMITVSKALTNSAMMAARAIGNRTLATRMASQTVLAGQQGAVANPHSIEAAINEMTPSAMRLSEDLVESPNVSGQVLKALQDNDRIVKEVLSAATPESMGPEALEAAAERARGRITSEFNEELFIDFDIRQNPLTKTRDLIGWLGRQDGSGGFASKRGAMAAAERRGITDFEAVDRGGQWFIELKRPIEETNLAQGFDIEKIPFSTSARMLLSGADTLLPSTIREATHLAFDARTKLSKEIQQIQKKMKPLKKKDRQRLARIFEEGETEGKWYTPGELKSLWALRFDKEITDREMLGYYTYKQVSDLDYFLRNSSEYAKRQRNGVISVELSAPDLEIPLQNAKIHDTIQAGMDQKYWVQMDGQKLIQVHTPGKMTTELLQKMKEKGYKLVQLERAFVRDGVPVEFILAKGDNIREHPLEIFQVGYRPGGHRMYEGKHLIKQSRQRKTIDGKRLVLNPLTHHVFTSKSDSQKYTAQLERARQAYVRAVDGEISEEAATIEIQEAGIGVNDFDAFHRLVLQEKVEARTPFETVFDREAPLADRGIVDDGTVYFAQNEELSGISGWYSDTGRLYYSAKGERLRDPQGDLSPVLDPFKTAHKAIENAARLRAFGDYRSRVVDDWLKTFQAHIETPGNAVSNVQRFLGAKVITGDKAVAAKAEGVRTTIKRMLSTPTKDTEAIQSGMMRLADWVDSSSLPGARKIGRLLYNADNANPVQSVKKLAFDLYLGLGDLSQLLIQPMTMFVALSASPKWGAQGMAAYPFMRGALRRPDGKVEDVLATAQEAATGLSPAQFKAMMKDLRASGKAEVSGELSMLDAYSNPQIGWWAGRGVEAVRDMGRIPFYEAERANRLVAYSMAWREWHHANPKEAIGKLSQAGIEFIAKRTNDYSVSMTSASSAWWQRGALSIPTQFLSYQARLIEAMLPKSLGGADHFTPRQKLQILAGQLLLHGSYGVPAGGWVLDMYQKATGHELEPAEFRFLTSGLIDSLIFSLSNGSLDTNWASRSGLGELMGGLVADMFNGDRSFVEIIGGPAYAGISDTIDALQRLAMISRAEVTAGEMTAEGLSLLAKNARSWDRYSRAYHLLKYGEYLSRKGDVIGGIKATKMEAVATALGIPLRQVTDLYDMRNQVRDSKKGLKGYVDMIAGLRNRAMNEPENSERHAATIRGLVSMLDVEDQQYVLAQTDKRFMVNDYNNAYNRYYEYFNQRTTKARNQTKFLSERYQREMERRRLEDGR